MPPVLPLLPNRLYASTLFRVAGAGPFAILIFDQAVRS